MQTWRRKQNERSGQRRLLEAEYKLGLIADYVIEYGSVGTSLSTGLWTYRKWESGVTEAWCKWEGSLTHYATPFTGTYGYYQRFAFPSVFGFIDVPFFTYTAGVANNFAWAGANTSGGVTNTNCNCYAITTVSGTQTVRFDIYVKGKWK